jgi:hypothetical protein
MYTLVIIETHSVQTIHGTPISCVAKFNTIEKDESFVAAYVYNDNGRLIDYSKNDRFESFINEVIQKARTNV